MLNKIKSFLSFEKVLQGLVQKGLTAIIILICSLIFGYSQIQFFKLKNQVLKMQFVMSSQSKDYAVRFTISINELHLRLKSLIENNCDYGVYLSYFSSDDKDGTWLALVSNHQLLTSQDNSNVEGVMQKSTTSEQEKISLRNVLNFAKMATLVVKQQDFNPIYTTKYPIGNVDNGIDPTSLAFFVQELEYGKPSIITEKHITKYPWLGRIFGNMLLDKFNFTDKVTVYVYSLYSKEESEKRVRFLTLLFTNQNNVCKNDYNMIRVFENAKNTLNEYNV